MKDFTINLKTSIMIDACVALNPANYNFGEFLRHYDYTFLKTQTPLSKSMLTELVNSVKQNPNGLQKSAFIFTQINNSNKALTKHMETLILQKAMNFGYHPKQILNNNLNNAELIKVLSLKSSPFEYGDK